MRNCTKQTAPREPMYMENSYRPKKNNYAFSIYGKTISITNL